MCIRYVKMKEPKERVLKNVYIATTRQMNDLTTKDAITVIHYTLVDFQDMRVRHHD